MRHGAWDRPENYMAIRINQNLISLLIRRNLDKVTSRLLSSNDRLTSGEKIRRSADDPSGLASSQQLRYEIRGYQRNQQNIGNALSLVGVTETGLASIAALLQQGRELAVQAGNDTFSAANRTILQNQLDQIVEQIDEIAKQTKFQSKSLLDGALFSQNIQTGLGTGDGITITVRDVRKAALGVVAQAVGNNPASSGAILGGGDLVIVGVNIPATQADGVSYIDPSNDQSDESAIAKARAINQVTNQTGVTAFAEPAEFVAAGASISSVVLDGITNDLKINGISVSPISVSAGDSGGDLVQAINAVKEFTGVEAIVLNSGELKLIAPAGVNIDIVTTGSVADELGLATSNGNLDTVVFGKVRLQADQPFSISGTTALIGFDGSQTTINFDASTAIQSVSAVSSDSASTAILIFDAAIRQVSLERAGLGAIENRLTATVDDLGRRIEELTASDSRIRDTDFAVETAVLAQSQILQEAAIALLIQANIAPRTALQLLQR